MKWRTLPKTPGHDTVDSKKMVQIRGGFRRWSVNTKAQDAFDHDKGQKSAISGRLNFIHHQCWEVLPFCRFQRQRCIKIRVLRAQDFYTPLALKTAKGQHLPALVVYKIQSPNFGAPSSLVKCTFRRCSLSFVISLQCLTLLGARDCPL